VWRSIKAKGMAEAMRDSDRGDAVHKRVLDRGIRHPRSNRLRRIPRQCPRYKESARRKSDVQESQWLLKLHTFGLLRNSFRSSQWPTNRKLNVRRSVGPYDFPRCQRHTNRSARQYRYRGETPKRFRAELTAPFGPRECLIRETVEPAISLDPRSCGSQGWRGQ